MGASTAPLYEPFTITVIPDRAEVAVVLGGELDMTTSCRLEHQVRELRAVGFDRIIVDLRRVSFLDTTALRVLLDLRDDAGRDDYRLIVVPGPPAVQRIFEITATHALFAWRDY